MTFFTVKKRGRWLFHRVKRGALAFFRQRKGGDDCFFTEKKGATTIFHRKKRERRFVFIETKGGEEFFSREKRGRRVFFTRGKIPRTRYPVNFGRYLIEFGVQAHSGTERPTDGLDSEPNISRILRIIGRTSFKDLTTNKMLFPVHAGPCSTYSKHKIALFDQL